MSRVARSLRADEARYRALGKFELAVQYQRQADLVEAGVDSVRCLYSVFDRGALGPVVCGAVGHLTAFELPSGLVWALTRDRLEELFWILCEELDLTGEQLCQAALDVAADRQAREQLPPVAESSWAQGWDAYEQGRDRDENPYASLTADGKAAAR